MGYTIGRRFTDEKLIAEARKYKTKKEMVQCDPSLVKIARNRGLQDKIFEHIIDTPFSTPQLICKLILETVLETKCMYDTRQIIKPYELDIYFPEYKLAVEYNGSYWHTREDSIRRDKIKKQKCEESNIKLLILQQNSKQWEEDVKKQLVDFLPVINSLTNKSIKAEQINSIICKDIYKDLPSIKDMDELNKKISLCKNIKEFKEKYKKEYRYLMKSKQLYLLDHIRTAIKPRTDEQLLEECKKIKNYSEFITNHFDLYNSCHRRKILEEASKDMVREKNYRYKHCSNEELLQKIPSECNTYIKLKSKDGSLYNEIKKRNLLHRCLFVRLKKRKTAQDYQQMKNVQYITDNIEPHLIQGLSLNDLIKKQILTISISTLVQIINTYGNDYHKDLAAKNAKANTLRGLTHSPTRIRKQD